VPLDPRTPVLAGVGQLTHRPARGDPATFTEPVALMASALARAGEDAAGGGHRSALLDRVDELTAIPGFVWSVADPALAAATAAGVTPKATRLGFVGATTPQRAVFDASLRIARGELDVAAIVGAEAVRSLRLAREAGVDAGWATQDDAVPSAPVVFDVPDALTDHERACGLALPVTTYALFESSLRRARGWSRREHLAVLDALSERQRAVATTVDGAWLRDAAPTAASAPSVSNRMVTTPYTKLLASNVVVDMGAAVIVCSLAAARDAGVPEDRLVFPRAGAYGREQWFVSTRRSLSTSLAMRACARALFGSAPPGPDEVALLDLYSCFPSAVQMGADALGLDLLADPRAPSVTGGMTYFGGPGNNYVTHALATMVEQLRARPGAVGLVTANGWYASTHAWGTYSTAPPDGFRVHDVQQEVDAVDLLGADDGYEGEAVVEAYTVAHDRDGTPTRVVAALQTPAGARRLVATDDTVLAAEVVDADPLAARVRVDDGRVRLG
jgi:acetyl-CoA C-acetyltransferase